jgi:hypothetical protein
MEQVQKVVKFFDKRPYLNQVKVMFGGEICDCKVYLMDGSLLEKAPEHPPILRTWTDMTTTYDRRWIRTPEPDYVGVYAFDPDLQVYFEASRSRHILVKRRAFWKLWGDHDTRWETVRECIHRALSSGRLVREVVTVNHNFRKVAPYWTFDGYTIKSFELPKGVSDDKLGDWLKLF